MFNMLINAYVTSPHQLINMKFYVYSSKFQRYFCHTLAPVNSNMKEYTIFKELQLSINGIFYNYHFISVS